MENKSRAYNRIFEFLKCKYGFKQKKPKELIMIIASEIGDRWDVGPHSLCVHKRETESYIRELCELKRLSCFTLDGIPKTFFTEYSILRKDNLYSVSPIDGVVLHAQSDSGRRQAKQDLKAELGKYFASRGIPFFKIQAVRNHLRVWWEKSEWYKGSLR